MSAPTPTLPPGGLTGSGSTVTATFPIGVDQDLGDGLEVVAPGALDMQAEVGFRALPGLPALTFQSQHDPTIVYATTSNGSTVAAVNETAFAVVSRMPSMAQLLTEQIGSGVYAAISPSFMALAAVWDVDPVTDMVRRTITEMFLLEISAVSCPAWQGTTLAITGGSRSLEPPSPTMTRAMLDSAFARIGRIEAEDAQRAEGKRQSVMAQLAYHDHVSTQLELERRR